jgi:HK97 family phage major capsid protein
MNLEQLKARLAQIIARNEELASVEDMTDDVVTEINSLNDEFESIRKKIEAAEKMDAMKAAGSVSNRKTGTGATPVAAEVVSAKTKFNNFGDFLMAVKNSAMGNLDTRFKGAMQERNAEDGGYLVPEEFMSEIAKKMGSDESLLAKSRQLLVSGNTLSIVVDESAPWSNGVQAYWVAEGNPITKSGKGQLAPASWKLKKLAALIEVTDELLEDTTALESYIKNAAPEAIMHTVNSAIIAGNGVGKPLGILNSGFKYKVSKEGGQAADTIVAKNVIKMFSRMIPAARAGAAWYINAGCEDQLRLMKDDLGNFIYLAPGSQMNQSPYGLLLGLPVIPMLGSMPALGDEGDIILANFNYYWTISKAGGIKASQSAHLYFDRDSQAFKFTLRVDGSCPYKTPVKTENGNYEMSAFVTLEAR